MFRFRKELFLLLVVFTSFSAFADNSVDENLSRLHSAVTNNDFYTAKELLTEDVDFITEVKNLNLLQRALAFGGKNGDWSIFYMVLEKADKEVLSDPFLLKIAIQSGCLEVVRALVNAGVPVDLENINFMLLNIFPHIYASSNGMNEISKYLEKELEDVKYGYCFLMFPMEMELEE